MQKLANVIAAQSLRKIASNLNEQANYLEKFAADTGNSWWEGFKDWASDNPVMNNIGRWMAGSRENEARYNFNTAKMGEQLTGKSTGMPKSFNDAMTPGLVRGSKLGEFARHPMWTFGDAPGIGFGFGNTRERAIRKYTSPEAQQNTALVERALRAR